MREEYFNIHKIEKIVSGFGMYVLFCTTINHHHAPQALRAFLDEYGGNCAES